MSVVTLFRPVGPAELSLIRDSGWSRVPPRLPEQPFFYPVENEHDARQIAVDAAFLERYPVRQVGNATHRERWIPAEELDDFNAHIVGAIELIESFR
ncbi:MAG TPA: hypothetical protein VFB22_11755 [Candidatus Baltobacteraceae bacterium]|nr:hypothetical protein [Candidatus Baltobacteraceae bacterium]